MLWRRLFLVLAIQVTMVLPAPAGIFFNRNKNKPNPAQRVPELLGIIKTDPDDGKRMAAAEELRQYDSKAHPEIVPILMDVAQRDTKPEVRAEAVVSLSKIRPVSQEVGFVLEQLQTSDQSPKVRWQARTALWQYQLAGYRSGKVEGPALNHPPTTQEPPLADPAPTKPLPAPRVVPTPAPVVTPPAASGYRPAARPPLVPAEPPQLQRPPASDGPSLIQPQ